MAYIGVSNRFDGGLTNPSRQIGGGNPALMGAFVGKDPRQMPGGTKPTSPVSAPISGVSSAMPQTSTAQGNEYWAWPTGGGGTQPAPAPAQKPTVYGPGADPSRGVVFSGEQKQNDPIGPYIDAPPIPTAAAPGKYVGSAPAGAYVGYNPTAYQEEEIDIPEAGVDTRKVVESTRHFLDEEMAGGMADAARRFGMLGGLKSSGYAGTLGEKQRARDRDLAGMYYKYDYDAAQQDASRKSAAREGRLQRGYGAWGTLEGLKFNESGRHTDYNVKQQEIANSEAGRETGHNVGQQDRENALNLSLYGLGASEAERRQAYEQLKKLYGV